LPIFVVALAPASTLSGFFQALTKNKPLINPTNLRLEEVLATTWTNWNFNPAKLQEAKEKVFIPTELSCWHPCLNMQYFSRADGCMSTAHGSIGYGLTLRSFLSFTLPANLMKGTGNTHIPF